MKPFLEGKKSSGANSLAGAPAPLAAVTSALLRGGRAAPATPGAANPTIEVVKEGDKIIRLVVTCSCGERMEVECLYPPGI